MENDLPEEAIDLYLDSTRSNSKAKEQQLRRDATSLLKATFSWPARRFCRSCRTHKPLIGGTGRRNADGCYRWWKCAECSRG